MKKQFISLCMAWWAVTGWASPHTFQVSSPDRNYVFTFTQEEPEGKTRMYYTLSYKGKEIVHRSELGVEIENKLLESALGIENDACRNWRDNLTFIGADSASHDGTWQPLYGERKEIPDRYRSLQIKFRKGEAPASEMTGGYDRSRTYFMNVEVRAYNEGVAFRYHFPATSNGLFLHITDELTEFAMPEGTMAWHEPWAQAPVSLLPLEGWEGESERPLTMKLGNGLTVSLGEARMVDYVRTKFALASGKAHTLKTSMYDCADIITPYDTPWRVIMAAERPVDLIAHNFIYLNLNEPNVLQGDLSWIRPGKTFRSGLSQKEALAAVDFAAERGLQYIHLDAGWYGPEMKMESDATRISESKDLDIKAICDYASTKGIGVWLYVNQRALVQQIDRLLPLYKEWGIKGIKFGFVQVGNQFWTIWLHKAVRQCADYGIMVDTGRHRRQRDHAGRAPQHHPAVHPLPLRSSRLHSLLLQREGEEHARTSTGHARRLLQPRHFPLLVRYSVAVSRRKRTGILEKRTDHMGRDLPDRRRTGRIHCHGTTQRREMVRGRNERTGSPEALPIHRIPPTWKKVYGDIIRGRPSFRYAY